MPKTPIHIRELRADELHLLEDFLYEAIFQPQGAELLTREIIKTPAIWTYIDKFKSKQDDYCLVAENNKKVMGAVWVRILTDDVKGYGNIDSETPEFAISLFPEYRNMGIGTKLMQAMILYLKEKGYKKASLSVDKQNYATKMYKNIGFEIIEENEHDYLMILQLIN